MPMKLGETCMRKVTAQRIDSGGGWGMNLKFKCGDKTVKIGPSRNHANTVTSTPLLLAGGMCPTEVDKTNWATNDHHATVGDRFKITTGPCE